MSYAAILKDLKKRVKPKKLGITVQGFRETRSKDLLVELKCSKEDRGRLDIAFKEVTGASHLPSPPHPQDWGGEAYVDLKETWAFKLLKATHIKIGWVSCRVRKKTVAEWCYCCLGFGHMATDYRGPDRSSIFWRCGKEGHAGSCSKKPQYYLYGAREGIPGTMRCAAFLRGSPEEEAFEKLRMKPSKQ